MKSIRSADLLARLMLEGLGYKQFAAAGGDIGSRVVRLMALAHPEWLIGIHLTDIGFPREVAFPPEVPNPSPVEQQFLGSVQGCFSRKGPMLCFKQQSHKPSHTRSTTRLSA